MPLHELIAGWSLLGLSVLLDGLAVALRRAAHASERASADCWGMAAVIAGRMS
jgi:hypothetical protein